MRKFLQVFVIFLVANSYSAQFHYNHHHDHNFFQTDPANLTRCNELNLHRWELHKCCKYPHINLHRTIIDNCLDECVGSVDHCCPIGCLWRTMKISYDESSVNLAGLKRTFKSAAMDGEWDEIIDKAVDECSEEVQPEGLRGPCQYPGHLLKVIGCATKKMFLQCPQMHLLPACETTKMYVEECM